jgi:DNA repair protein RecN (Recombination protein N)
VLRRLTVRNLAIVEDIDLELGAGLTVITGETGAGKSILVDALALLAGGRGSVDLVRRGADRLVVSGEFGSDRALRDILADAGLPEGDPLLVRRELTADGRGRAFVEDEPAAIRTLARLGARLVAIQGQNSERELTDPDAPLELLDGFAKAGDEREAVSRAAGEWAAAREGLETLESSRRDRSARLETVAFQIGEIEAASPDAREEEDLAIERERLLHADRIRRAGESALMALSEGEDSAADRVGEAARAFAELAAIDPRERVRLEETEEVKKRITDLAAAARDAAAGIESDPDRLSAIESRLEKLSRVKRKYGPTLADARSLLDRLRSERDELSNVEDALDRRRREEEKLGNAYRSAAADLTLKRTEAAPRFSAAVERELGSLALEKARFRVALETVPEDGPRRAGRERAALLFQPNPGEPELPIDRIASGGELSRLQLAVQSVAAAKGARRRTLVFDEVDAGIGGRTAESVGKKLKALAARSQVFCVTHVPQIAALADRHFLAEKSETGGRTVAAVRLLDGKERVAEIARMLAGEKVPETAVRHARELLSQAGVLASALSQKERE